MPDPKALTQSLRDWFEKNARPALLKTEKPEQIKDYDRQAQLIDGQLKRQGELFPICVLGQARVGKSTLINTLVAETGIVVPSGGGDGPLTANALRVRYGTEKRFTVRYHGKQVINQTRFILESKLKRDTKAAAEAQVEETDRAMETEIAAFVHGTEEDKKTATEEAARRARLLVTGSQTEGRNIEYLIDALGFVQGLKNKHGSAITAEDLARLSEVKTATELGSNKAQRKFEDTGGPEFQVQLRLHACGYLAPLIADMQIEWPSEMLKDGVELIDLPGIGIHNDLYETVTARFLRNEAKAIMLVTDSGGLRKNDAELLRDSGFLNRFLHASDDPSADPVSLVVAVVKVDDVAKENWKNDKEQNGGKALKTKAQHFADVVATLRINVATQLRNYLSDVWKSTDDDLQREKEAIITRLSENVQVFPLSAPQYRLLLEDDPDEHERPFLPDVEATQIPALRRAVLKISHDCIREREARLTDAVSRFFGQLRARLAVAGAQLSSETRVQNERLVMEAELTAFLAPKQKEFDTRRGEFRAYLRQTVPAQIEDKVKIAGGVAQKEIEHYMRILENAHWGTLRAAVRHSGTFYGARQINLPHDFALRFEEPVAQVWSGTILQGLRRQTGAFASYQAEAVKEVLEWASASGIKVTIKLLEALVEDVQQQRQQLNAVGKEAIEELRNQVRKELIRKVEGPIRARCENFVAEGSDVGRGVKWRIIDLFRRLASEVVEAAAEPAAALLTLRFKEVEKEIVSAFKEHANPLEEAADALLQKFDKQLVREGVKAAEALALVEEANTAIPAELEEIERQRSTVAA